MVEFAAIHLLTGTQKRERLTLILTSLNWLTVHFKFRFMILLFLFNLEPVIPSLSTEYETLNHDFSLLPLVVTIVFQNYVKLSSVL